MQKDSLNSLKIKIVNDLISGDKSKILLAAVTIIQAANFHFTNEQVKLIVERGKALPKSTRKTLRDYREVVKVAVSVIKHFHKGNKCKCELYQEYSMFLPAKEIAIGFLKSINKPRFNKERYQEEQALQCLICQTKWQVTTLYSYHYPIYEWTKNS